VIGLGRYAVYATLLADGESTPWASGRTLEPPPPTRTGDDVRQRSREKWGIPAGVIDAELELLAGGEHAHRRSPPGETFGAIARDTAPESTG
jgi:hypothetical protein